MISHWLHLISGRSQDRKNNCGTEAAWRAQNARNSPTFRVDLHEWCDDFAGIAKMMKRNSTPNPQVAIAGYSWGGDAAIDFCKLLMAEGIKVARLDLCDAVFRSDTWPTWFQANLLSLTSIPKLSIPTNVANVWWCYQRNNRPAGHVPVAKDAYWTKIEDGVQLDGVHADMDESPEYFNAVARSAAIIAEAA